MENQIEIYKSETLQHPVIHGRKATMSIRVGILCEKCQTVHFVGTSEAIKPLRKQGMFVIVCRFCSQAREFRKEAMLPFRVSDVVFETGHAREGEYALIPSGKHKS